jgi:hypothetical protein
LSRFSVAQQAVHDNICSHEYAQNPFMVLLPTLEKSFTPLAAIVFAWPQAAWDAIGTVAIAL